MTTRLHVLVFDPVAFRGGSKVVGETILEPLVEEGAEVTVVTSDRESWTGCATRRIEPGFLSWTQRRTSGVFYFIRHLILALWILGARLRFGPVDVAIGNSGPGVDLALYLCRSLLGYQLVQLVQGPVAPSRTIGRCLAVADHVHYLDGTGASLRDALLRVVSPERVDRLMFTPSWRILRNGLNPKHWPSRCQQDRPVLFWAASLLKWKGLDLLVESLHRLAPADRPPGNVCYIRPRETSLGVSEPDQTLPGIEWRECPRDIDVIRAHSSIFVSTSVREPFGLSILEALAAGHCVLIPADGAYWDQVLEDDVNCVKYTPQDADALARAISGLNADPDRVRRIGLAGRVIAEMYSADRTYAGIRDLLRSFARPRSRALRSAAQ